MMKLWLDDNGRPVPEGWVATKNPIEAIWLLRLGQVEALALDHDLGYFLPGTEEEVTGHDVASEVEALAFDGSLPRIPVTVLTDNPVGRRRIEAALAGAERYWARNLHLACLKCAWRGCGDSTDVRCPECGARLYVAPSPATP